ncbi:hypothetical protein [Nocardia sp. NPDC057668]|uniref:hypothetical protein n=1 Tax=Nocardia sp. NPDC057668 TaxID=3346202 RepID=UPI00366B8B26
MNREAKPVVYDNVSSPGGTARTAEGDLGRRYRDQLVDRLAVRGESGDDGAATELNQFFLWHRSAQAAPEAPWEARGGGLRPARGAEPRGVGSAVPTELPKPLVVLRFDRRTGPAGAVAIE